MGDCNATPNYSLICQSEKGVIVTDVKYKLHYFVCVCVCVQRWQEFGAGGGASNPDVGEQYYCSLQIYQGQIFKTEVLRVMCVCVCVCVCVQNVVKHVFSFDYGNTEAVFSQIMTVSIVVR